MKHYIQINKRNHEYSITPLPISPFGEHLSLVVCEAANINQEFENEDIPALLEDLPNLIESESEYRLKKSAILRFRLTPEEKAIIQENAKQYGFSNMSSFLKEIALHPNELATSNK